MHFRGIGPRPRDGALLRARERSRDHTLRQNIVGPGLRAAVVDILVHAVWGRVAGCIAVDADLVGR